MNNNEMNIYYDILNDIIDKGLELLKNKKDDNNYKTWVKYSKDNLALVLEKFNKKSFMANYNEIIYKENLTQQDLINALYFILECAKMLLRTQVEPRSISNVCAEDEHIIHQIKGFLEGTNKIEDYKDFIFDIIIKYEPKYTKETLNKFSKEIIKMLIDVSIDRVFEQINNLEEYKKLYESKDMVKMTLQQAIMISE